MKGLLHDAASKLPNSVFTPSDFGWSKNMNKPPIQLLGNRVLIEPVEEETVSGFIIPEEYRSFRVGIVAAVGNGARLNNGLRNSIPLSIGDKVVLSDDYRMPIELDHKQYFLVSDEKVMAVLQ